ncbi:DNA adenine methylase [Methylophilus methylotrophus]|uniref:DNA adenine methylase n=1 Tax=Methylophilus methylotrophus TaxID=17 RepID=UPI0003A895DF
MRYDGGKGVSFPHIINLIPPHRRYIETHLGGGAVMRHKRPAISQIGIDLDSKVIETWSQNFPHYCDIIHGDAVSHLEFMSLDADTVVYADPPYMTETRRRTRVYRCDYTEQDHVRLLECLTSLPCKVILSGYPSKLYEKYLANWSVYRFEAKTHVGIREEWVWFNYKKPSVLHDDRYLGSDFRERELIKRRQDRLRDRISKLSESEKSSLYSWLSNEVKQRVDI